MFLRVLDRTRGLTATIYKIIIKIIVIIKTKVIIIIKIIVIIIK